MSLATNVSNESGTGAVRSVDLAAERWDLVCYDSLGDLARAMQWFTDYEMCPTKMVARSLECIGRFLGGSRGDTLARGWTYLAMAIQRLDLPDDYAAWCCTHQTRVEDGHTGFSLIPHAAIRRISTTCHEGAVKYGEHNWYNGFQVSGLLNHSANHHLKWLNGLSKEDDLGHSSWAYMASIYMLNHRPDMQKLLLGDKHSITPEIKQYHAQLAAERERLKLKQAEEEAQKEKAKLTFAIDEARLKRVSDEAYADHYIHSGPVIPHHS